MRIQRAKHWNIHQFLSEIDSNLRVACKYEDFWPRIVSNTVVEIEYNSDGEGELHEKHRQAIQLVKDNLDMYSTETTLTEALAIVQELQQPVKVLGHVFEPFKCWDHGLEMPSGTRCCQLGENHWLYLYPDGAHIYEQLTDKKTLEDILQRNWEINVKTDNSIYMGEPDEDGDEIAFDYKFPIPDPRAD